MPARRIVVTGGDGFIGRNLLVRLQELGYKDVISIGRDSPRSLLDGSLVAADFVFHLAGVNRPHDPKEFETVNVDLTAHICRVLADSGRAVPVVYTSSTQVEFDHAYGRSKHAGELEVFQYGATTGSMVFVLRLTNVFGKWSRPNYNSVVATFCHNLANGLSIKVNDPAAVLKLLYIDDVIASMIRLLDSNSAQPGVVELGPVYNTTVGEVATLLGSFVTSRQSNTVPSVGFGLTRALYSTYLSYLRPADFVYSLGCHVDARGSFVEMLKTLTAGQFSFFTAPPGVTRGGHYHHTKTEKFFVVHGSARFGFRNIVTDETHEVVVTDQLSQVVETVPGWAHEITNIGTDVLIVVLWANEIFDQQHPDTFASRVIQ